MHSPDFTTDFATARTMMVDSQVRPNKVTDKRILDAMRALPREAFLPANVAALAYADEDVPLGNGRVMLEPMVIARMVQIAAIEPGQKVLVIASGTGYGAALLAACGAVVTAVEEDRALLAIARTALAGMGGVTLVEAPLDQGSAQGGPYDVVFLEGAAEEMPAAWASLVKPQGGRFVGIQAHAGRVSQAVSGALSGGKLVLLPRFDCASPKLPAFRRTAGFVF
jgi:protein-L-isoaspartate(D-aspartate) O-methyltransferase